jgi:hypothetical protein
MGSDVHYSEERPAHSVTVDGFWIDRYAVTKCRLRRVHRRHRLRPLDPALYPGAQPDLLKPGSVVFSMPGRPVRPRNMQDWWKYVPGADWRHPEGPGSTIAGRASEPVVHNRVRRCRRLRGLDRQGSANRSGVGSLPRAAGWTAPPIAGATNSRRTGGGWPIPGRASSPGRTKGWTGFRGARRSARFPPMVTACSNMADECFCGAHQQRTIKPAPNLMDDFVLDVAAWNEECVRIREARGRARG